MLHAPILARVRCLREAGLARMSLQNVLGLVVGRGSVERVCPHLLEVPWLVTKPRKKKESLLFITDAEVVDFP